MLLSLKKSILRFVYSILIVSIVLLTFNTLNTYAGSLVDKRLLFTKSITKLLIYSHGKGYNVVLGEVKRDAKATYGHPRSVHKVGLAAHILLYDNEGRWLRGKKGRIIYTDLHEYWESLGGAEEIEGDANHFSFEYQGVR